MQHRAGYSNLSKKGKVLGYHCEQNSGTRSVARLMGHMLLLQHTEASLLDTRAHRDETQ